MQKVDVKQRAILVYKCLQFPSDSSLKRSTTKIYNQIIKIQSCTLKNIISIVTKNPNSNFFFRQTNHTKKKHKIQYLSQINHMHSKQIISIIKKSP